MGTLAPEAVAQAHLWSQRFGDASDQTQTSTSAAADGSGNVVLAGWFAGTMDFGGGPLTSAGNTDIFVAKFDPSGNHLWSRHFGDTGFQNGYGAAVDGSGNVLVTGEFFGTVDFGGGPLTSAGSNDIFVAKFDSNGNHIWSKRFGDANVNQQGARGVAADGPGNVVLTGRFNGTVDFGGGPLTSAGADEIFIARFDPNGNHIWSKRFGDASPQEASGIAADGSGKLVLTGSFVGTVDFGGGPLTSAGGAGGFRDIFLAKFDSDGNHLWSRHFGDTNQQVARGVAADGSGNTAVTGEFLGTVNFGGGPLTSAGGTDIFLAKFDSDGNHLWSKRFGGAGNQDGRGVAEYASGNIVFTGSFAGTVDFGGGPFTTSTGTTGIFVAKFDPNGNHLWSRNFGVGRGHSVAACALADFVVTGSFLGTVDFGGGPLTSAGGTDIFVARFTDSNTSAVPIPSFGEPATLGQNYPNPFNPTTRIECRLPERSPVVVGIYDPAGALVVRLDRGIQGPGTYRMEWNGRDAAGRRVRSGAYFYRLEGVRAASLRHMILLK